MTKTLEIGKDYGEIFGLDKEKNGESMVFNGGISWTATSAKGTMTMDSQKTTDNALAYINSSTAPMGSICGRR